MAFFITMRHFFDQLLNFSEKPLQVTGLRPSSTALLVAETVAKTGRPVLCVLPAEDLLAGMEQDISFFTSSPVFCYPGYEIPPYTPLSPDSSTTAARLSTLYRVLTATADSPFVLLCSVEALLRRILPLSRLDRGAELVIRGEETDPTALVAALTKNGYELVSLVQNSGEFAVRGGIIDIYPPPFAGNESLDAPVRLDFFGETIESIRYFDPISQRSIKEVEEALFLPVSDILFPESDSAAHRQLLADYDRLAATAAWQYAETKVIREKLHVRSSFPGIEFFLPLFYEKLSAPLDMLPANTLVFLHDPIEASRTVRLTWERIEKNYEESLRAGKPCFPPASLFLSEEKVSEALAGFHPIPIHELASPGQEEEVLIRTGNHLLLKQQIAIARQKDGVIAPLVNQIRQWQEERGRIALACRSEKHARHIGEMLAHYDLAVRVHEAPLNPAQLDAETVTLIAAPLSSGFDLPDLGLHLLSENELFGEKRLGGRKRKKRPPEGEPVRFEELRAGDYIVHADHGIGLFQGIVNMALNGVANDFLQITYEGDDILYVPIDRLGTVNKYQGIADQPPKINKLGGKVWAKTKRKVTEAVWKVAQELLDIYARRKLAVGHAFTPPGTLFGELEESFPYEETAGQTKAINDVLHDLVQEQTMDRLVCGDVGYGKTEVAIRAAFKVVEDGFQVAVLVPTTVLAEQHAESFSDRFSGFPVRIECLNRFRSAAQQKQTLEDLSLGRTDIVIGTHRLLSKDVVFKRLGLLIIDEEHRFGVAHKERIKKIKSNVDVLTLTATPIPRTLQLSLLGIRDLSVISTPPGQRRAVKTFVAKHDDLVIKEAVTKELQRKGQVFLVHNRVHSIHETAATVQKLVPQARVAVAHGQMPGQQLEEIMVRFIKREVDVLVTTTIIESGLDIPNANTIIITRADRFGLAEIYQLRGRVGRSSQQAYAYLLVPSLDGLSRDAKQRLRALMDYNELGGGFKLAMSDLQIRGGGSILGKSQSGNIAAVGYDLYLDLLQKTVDDLKRRGGAGEPREADLDFEPEINLPLSAFIPQQYIEDSDQRYIAYRKITSIRDEHELHDLEEELRDRYGEIPAETINLLHLITLKFAMRTLKIAKLEQGGTHLVLSFHSDTPVQPERILSLITNSKNTMRLTPEGKLIVPLTQQDRDSIFRQIKKVLQALH